MSEQEQTELQRRREQSRRNRSQAFAALFSVLSGGKSDAFVAGEAPLLAGLRLLGRKTSLPELVALPDMTLESCSDELEYVKQLQKLCAKAGVRYRQVIIGEPYWWKKSFPPLLAFTVDDVRPVLITPVSGGKYELTDLKEQTKMVLNRRTESLLSPRAFSFYRPFPVGKIGFIKLVKFCLQNSRRESVVVFCMSGLNSMLQALIPVCTGVVFQHVIPEADIGFLQQIFLLLLCVVLARWAFSITESVALLRIHGRFELQGQSALWDRLLSLPVSFFRSFTAGDLAQRSLGLSTIQELIAAASMKTIISCVFSLIFAALMFYYAPLMALPAIGISLFFLFLTILAGVAGMNFQRQMVELEGKISGMVLQFFDGIAKLRTAGAENKALFLWAESFAAQKSLFKKNGFLTAIYRSLQAGFPVLSLGLIILVYRQGVANGTSVVSAANFMAFMSAYAMVQTALFEFSGIFLVAMGALPVWNRLRPLLEEEPETCFDKPSPGVLNGNIDVEHVFFRYNNDGPLILNDVSLQIRAGDFVAIVGDSGSGKSTLFRLLLGFDFPESGSIYYDGKDLAELNLVELRRQIGVVLQNSGIVGGSIAENIIGHDAGYNLDHAWKAAALAGFDNEIREMPMQMYTVLAPGGGTLSGGQRQRLMIARALLRNPQLVFFDEATSALDNRTQQVVTRSLEEMAVTRVVIAHRLSTIIKADCIYVMKAGRVVESGNYENLMAKKGEFFQLARRQLA
jgi:NHLM bacteriocin system ABC transporter ATP-binding protein